MEDRGDEEDSQGDHEEMKEPKYSFNRLRVFLGDRIILWMLISVAAGIVLGLVEMLFAFSLQMILKQLNIADSMVELPGFLAGSVRTLGQAIAKTRTEVMLALKELGVGTQVHYIPVYRHPYYRRMLKVDPKKYPSMEKYYSECLSLPLFHAMTEQDVLKVTRAVKEIVRK